MDQKNKTQNHVGAILSIVGLGVLALHAIACLASSNNNVGSNADVKIRISTSTMSDSGFTMLFMVIILFSIAGIAFAIMQLCNKNIKNASIVSALCSFATFSVYLLSKVSYVDGCTIFLLVFALIASIGGLLSLVGLKNAL